MPDLLAPVETLEEIVRAALGDKPGMIQLGNVHINLTEEGLESDPQLNEDWNVESFRSDLERLMKENSAVAALLEKERVISQLAPYLIGNDSLNALTKDATQGQNDSKSGLATARVPKSEAADPPLVTGDEESRKIMASYKEGGTSRYGGKISKIIGLTKDFIVFTGNEGWVGQSSVGYEYWPDVPKSLTPAIGEFNRLGILAKCSLNPIHRDVAKLHLAMALFSAFHLPSGEDVLKPFEPIEPLIKKKSEENARFSYIFWGGVFAILACLAITSTYYNEWVDQAKFRDVLFGAMAGAVGASVSVIQRGKKLLFEPYAGSFFVAFQGIIRITLGIIFGVFTVIAIKAGVLLNVVSTNFYLLLTFCIVAGVSERFVPDLIERLENQKNSGNQ